MLSEKSCSTTPTSVIFPTLGLYLHRTVALGIVAAWEYSASDLALAIAPFLLEKTSDIARTLYITTSTSTELLLLNLPSLDLIALSSLAPLAWN